MAKLSILPFFLLLAVALPLLLAVSAARPIITEVDCVQRGADSIGEDVVEDGSVRPSDDVELEISDTDEVLADDDQGFFQDEDEAGSMPTDNDVELDSDTDEQLANDQGFSEDEDEDEAGSMPCDDNAELESDTDEQLADDQGFSEDEAGSMPTDDDDVELESDTDEQLADEQGFFENEAEAGSVPSDDDVELDSDTDEQLVDDQGFSEDEDEAGSMPSNDDVELESDTNEELADDQGFFDDEDEADSVPSDNDVELESDTDGQLADDQGFAEEGSVPSDDNMELESDTEDEQLAEEGFFNKDEEEAGYILMPTDNDDVEDAKSTGSDDLDVEGNLGIPVRNVVTPAFFNSIINKAPSSCKGKKFYTRAAFLTAAKSYPKFGQLRNDADSKREIAAFFAHVTHETGSLCYIEEIKKSRYCEPKATQWPCARGKQYYGRGPLQLTWNYNYGPCGRANKFDGLRNPDIVARNPVVAWKASLWFWMKNVRPVVGRGFGATIRAINGALECNGKNPAAVRARVNFYRDYCRRFRVSPGPNLTC